MVGKIYLFDFELIFVTARFCDSDATMTFAKSRF